MNTTYRLIGQGPHKVICIHGWFGSAEGWGPFVESLDTQAFSYAFMDCRGYGGAKAQKGEYSAEEVARDVLTLADHLGWERFSLIGHSMGGMYVQRVLVEAPQRVNKIVALTPVPADGYPFDEAGYAFFDSAADSPDVRRQIIDKTTGNRLTPVWIERIARHSLDHASREAFAAYLKAWARSNFSAQIQGNPVAIKLIIGEHDPAINESLVNDHFLGWYPNIEFEIMANAGHYPMFETPVALATSVERFLSA